MRLLGLLKRGYITKSLGRRYEVTSSSLCDDIIQRLSPSLKDYIGCTIIDYHPGHALLSKNLHDLLKPRKHILIEPDFDSYRSSLEPLLKASDSRYEYRDWTEERVWTPPEYIKEGLIPETPDDSNNATLQIVNATGRQIRTSRTESYRKSDTQSLAYAVGARHNNGFFARGPVRMLMWCEDAEKRAIVPRTIDARRKVAVLLETNCHVDEVVGFGWNSKGTQREHGLNIASSKLVRQRMKELNIYNPANRAVQVPEEAERYSTVSRPWHEELRDLEERFASGKLSQFVGLPPGPLEKKTTPGMRRKSDTRQTTPEYERLVYLHRTLDSQNSSMKKTQGFANQRQDIDDMYLRSSDPSMKASEREQILREVDQRTQELNKDLLKTTPNIQNLVHYITDDRRAFHTPGNPLLMWDQRSYEPLTASPSEFSHNAQLALLDFQNKPEGGLPLTNKQAVYFDILAAAFFAVKGPRNLTMLKNVAPGAFEALVTKVDELRDAREGGKKSVEDLNVRIITPKMLWRLAVEWDRWAFKPDLKDVLGLVGGNDSVESKRRFWM